MSKAVERAIRHYQACVTPEAVRETLKSFNSRGGHRIRITADGIRRGAASALQDVLATEIARPMGKLELAEAKIARMKKRGEPARKVAAKLRAASRKR